MRYFILLKYEKWDESGYLSTFYNTPRPIEGHRSIQELLDIVIRDNGLRSAAVVTFEEMPEQFISGDFVYFVSYMYYDMDGCEIHDSGITEIDHQIFNERDIEEICRDLERENDCNNICITGIKLL